MKKIILNFNNYLMVLICDWIYGNRSKSHIGSSILKILKHYNQPRIVSTQMKLAQKIDHFTVFESFSCTSCCSHKFLPKKIAG